MPGFNMTKDVEINGVKYQISKFTAKVGMWIAAQVFTKLAPFGMDGQLGINNLPEQRPAMTEKDFSDIVDYCMCATKRYEQIGNGEAPLPIMVQKGTWAIPDLEYDLTTVVALCAHVITFNVASFFAEESLKTLRESLKDLPLFSIQP